MNPMDWNNLYGCYSARKFSDIFPSLTSWNTLVTTPLTTLYGYTFGATDSSKMYYLLLARYCNEPIANSDENQFILKVQANVYQYGPTFIKKDTIQNTIRTLSEDELLKGGDAMYNHAMNPATVTSVDAEITTINDQNTTKYKKAKIDAYASQYVILRDELGKEFTDKFKKLFLQVVAPQIPLWYTTDIGD